MNDLYTQSQYVEIITGLLEQEYGKRPVVTRCHTIKMHDGNTVFYVVTSEEYHFLVNIMGRKIQDNAVLYWVENINYAGKIDRYYFERDVFAITFKRGEKYSNEYLSYFYVYGNQYPAIRFIPEDVYPKYINMLDKRYKRHELKLPDDLMAKD